MNGRPDIECNEFSVERQGCIIYFNPDHRGYEIEIVIDERLEDI